MFLIIKSSWFKNGTYKSSTSEFNDGGVLKLVKFYPNVLVVTDRSITFMWPHNLFKTKMTC